MKYWTSEDYREYNRARRADFRERGVCMDCGEPKEASRATKCFCAYCASLRSACEVRGKLRRAA